MSGSWYSVFGEDVDAEDSVSGEDVDAENLVSSVTIDTRELLGIAGCPA